MLGRIATRCRFGLVALCWLTFGGTAFADKRVALVIGNSAYVNVPRLANPANDARLIADTLRSIGFTLVGGGAQVELDKPGLERALQQFSDALVGADVALFYYAGHGVQVRGANYLVPVGANPTRESDVDLQMLDTNVVLRQMEGAGTKLNLVILDACRNNPFGGRGLRGTDAGLAQMRAPEGTLISFATQPGNVAQDGADGDSPYTRALVSTMRKPGIDVLRAFNEVGIAVSDATGGQQQPWVSLSPIRGDFYFAGVPAARVPAQVSTVETQIDRPGSDYRQFDLPNADAQLCQQACLADKVCVAWTFVREGLQGRASRCWLKNQVPAPRSSNCCTSGVVASKNAAGAAGTR